MSITYPSLLHAFLFFFNDTATTEIYTLSLHDALPIWSLIMIVWSGSAPEVTPPIDLRVCSRRVRPSLSRKSVAVERLTIRLRSEEHTSELQSQSNLVCRLLLEKKKNNPQTSTQRTTGV